VKADGLAAGKGVVIADDRQTAEAAIASMMVDRQFGAAGDTLVLEECLTGPEVSFFVLCDGTTAVPLGTAQDHKRIWDDDKGPNTGGMGAFAPSPLVDAAMSDRVMRTIVAPVLDGMRALGEPYKGFLYVSLMLTGDGPKVIEFNVRLGDPETQVLLPILGGNLAELLLWASADADANDTGSRFSENEKRLPVSSTSTAVGVVLASAGYPGPVESGRAIDGLAAAEARPDVLVFHAGTRAAADGRIVTAGGRVLTVVATAPSFAEAMQRAYAAVDDIHFDGMQYRRDIGRKATTR
jgi:phosphoribosylamine--glycine ligase